MNIINLDKSAVIKWRLTDNCNYHCSYCIRRDFIIGDHSKDESKCFEALPKVINLAKKVSENTSKLVKIDLIGGEITLFKNLGAIIDKILENDFIRSVNITTNFFRPVDYWLNLTKNLNKITLTASFHPTECKEGLEAFIKKAITLKDKFKNFKCETVYTLGCTHTDKFIELCTKNNIMYMVEENLFDSNLKGINTSIKKKKPRYKVIDDIGETRFFQSRNDFIKKYGIDNSYVSSKGLYCTRNFDYVYIEQDIAMNCHKVPQKIDKFELEFKPHLCYRKGHEVCTLCGVISLLDSEKRWYDERDLLLKK